MNAMRRSFLKCLLGIVAAVVVGQGACDAADEEFPLEKEGLGKIKYGQKAEEVTTLLGKPDSKGKDREWAATGEWVQEWQFKKEGLTFQMASETKGGARTVVMITAQAPCKLATARGMKIGSTVAEVKKAYGDVEDKESSEAGKTFVAGSVYGGVIFTFTEGKVSQIFIGAAAE